MVIEVVVVVMPLEGVFEEKVGLVRSCSSEAKSRWLKDRSLHLLVRTNGLNP